MRNFKRRRNDHGTARSRGIPYKPHAVSGNSTALISEGWVYNIPYKGICINPITPQMVKDVFEMRLILETAIIKQISRSITEKTLQELQCITSRMKENPEEQGHYDFAVLDYDFHHKLYELRNNRLMISFYEQIAEFPRSATTSLILSDHTAVFKRMQFRYFRCDEKI